MNFVEQMGKLECRILIENYLKTILGAILTVVLVVLLQQ
jgi:hypothetical protein